MAKHIKLFFSKKNLSERTSIVAQCKINKMKIEISKHKKWKSKKEKEKLKMKPNLNKMKIIFKKLIVDHNCHYKNSKPKTKIKKNKKNENRILAKFLRLPVKGF